MKGKGNERMSNWKKKERRRGGEGRRRKVIIYDKRRKMLENSKRIKGCREAGDREEKYRENEMEKYRN